MSSFFQPARGASRDMAPGFIGQIFRGGDEETITGNNQSPQTAQVVTIATPASVDNEETYTITINGVDTSFTTDGSATQDELGEGLEAAINSNAAVRGLVTPVYDATANELSLTCTWPGISLEVSVSGGAGGNVLGAPTTDTAAASAAYIPFGRVLASDGYVTGENVPKVFLADKDLLVAQVDSYVITYDQDVIIRVVIEVDGAVYSAEHTQATDLATSGAALIAQLNNALPANTVLAAFSTATLTLTSELAGKPFVSSVSFGSGRDTGAAVKTSNSANNLTDLTRCMVGLSVRRADVENRTQDGDDPAYPPNAGVEVLQRGRMYVQRALTESIAPGNPLYVELDGDNAGRLYKTASSTRQKLPESMIRWERSESSTSSHGVTVIRLLRTGA